MIFGRRMLIKENSLFVYFCAESTAPKAVSQEGSIVLEGNTSVCDNQTTLREVNINSSFERMRY